MNAAGGLQSKSGCGKNFKNKGKMIKRNLKIKCEMIRRNGLQVSLTIQTVFSLQYIVIYSALLSCRMGRNR